MRKGLGLSLCLHLLWLAFTWSRQDWNAKDITAAKLAESSLQVRTITPEKFERELKDALEEGEKQIVAGDDQLKSSEAGKRKGRDFLSKHNQKVDFETRARHVGHFKNVLKEGLTQGKNKGHSEAPTPSKSLAERLFQLTPRPRDQESLTATTRETGRLKSRQPASLSPTSQPSQGEGFSSSPDYLKDVAVGANTLLNTREYRFYSFYERIREKLSYQWERNLELAFQKLFSAQRRLTPGEQLTQVQIRLNQEGQLDTVRVIGSSGSQELDNAALQAFQQASPFPNPPKEMLDASRKIQIRWDFVVLADETTGVRVKVRQGTW